MKVERSDDPSLRQALRAWRIEVDLPPGFQAGVWHRIRHDQERRAGRWMWLGQSLEWLMGDIRWAAALPTLALAIGFLLGLRHDGNRDRGLEDKFQIAYVESLDPYALAARHLEGP